MGSPIRGIAVGLVCVLSISSAAPAYADTCNFDYDCPSGMLCNYDSGVCEPTASSTPAAPSSSSSSKGFSTAGWIIIGVVVLVVCGYYFAKTFESSEPGFAGRSGMSLLPELDASEPSPGGLTLHF
jgi:hypothetical protein